MASAKFCKTYVQQNLTEESLVNTKYVQDNATD